MPIKYKIDVLAALKKAGYSSYRIRNEKLLGEATLQKLREGKPVSWDNISTICELLDCQPGDILQNQIFSIEITERSPIISASTKKLMNDTELDHLDGIKKFVVKKEATRANEALHQAARDYEKELDENPGDHISGDVTLEVIGEDDQ